MINVEEFIKLMDKWEETAKEEISKGFFGDDYKSIIQIRKLLSLLRSEVLKDPENMNIRVLRGASSLGLYGIRAFENTPLEDITGDIQYYLDKNLPGFKKLQPLGMDYGKGDPI